MNIQDINTFEDQQNFRKQYPKITQLFGAYFNEDALEPDDDNQMQRTTQDVLDEYVKLHKGDLDGTIEELNTLLQSYRSEQEIDTALDLLSLRVAPTKEEYPTYRIWLEHLIEFFKEEVEKK